MSYRILHCGKSLSNYHLCVEHSVVGFNTRGPEQGDIIFLVVNYKKKTICGLRAQLGEPADQQPWPDSERYVSAYNLIEIEHADPFDIRFLADYGGKYWPLKFLQQAKAIKIEEAIQALNEIFDKHQVEHPVFLDQTSSSCSSCSWVERQRNPTLSLSDRLSDILRCCTHCQHCTD